MAHEGKETAYRRSSTSTPTGTDPRETFTTELLRIMTEHEADSIARRVGRVRPELVAEFGEGIAASVVGHPEFTEYAVQMGELDRREADDAAYAALDHLRHHPDATPADAFTALTAPGVD
ncbi:hypothetical protein AB0P17_36345 [Streptomyces sp. NPDC088124]|uniref:hypothetical protein n=1 Tax=Streptomyces sp. NPDC088124 TaxID=3154654 RepID=UPI0034266A38